MTITCPLPTLAQVRVKWKQYDMANLKECLQFRKITIQIHISNKWKQAVHAVQNLK
jgi:hypothetical protein